ncbi:MAG: hypothetical protein QY332_13185 [Anaerolineales bacterium]|nr:MAG: hypothetical protein QY332_13185 [Anaerolineales bacterium]
MRKVRAYFQNLSFTEKSAPAALVVLCVLAFGSLIPRLGFYMDDWPYIFYARTKGIEGLRELLFYDGRPNAAWLYMTAFRLWDFNPLAWHLFALVMRIGTAVTFYIFMRLMWSERKWEAVVASLLFAVYPFFMLQPFAVGSTHHWFGFLAFNTSLILMVIGFREESPRRWLWIAPALGLEAAHLFTSEYFAGLELIRIVILWILAARKKMTFPKRAAHVFLNWLPYLFVMGLFMYWRIFIFEMTRNEPVIFNQLFSEPFKAIGFLFTAFFTDAVSVLTIGWQGATDAAQFDFSSVFVRYKLVVCLFVFGLAWLYLRKLLPAHDQPADDWKKSSVMLALAALMTSGLPIWFAGRNIVESKNLLSASRFGIPTMFGAALLVFWLAGYFIGDRNKKNIFLALLLALAVNFHLDNTKEFEYAWSKQQRFFQQLLWRAPMIEKGTAIFTDEEIMGIMGEYPLSFAIGVNYRVGDVGTSPHYWYFPFLYTNPDVDSLLLGEPLEFTRLNMKFEGNSKQMLLLDYNPEMKRCLWILQPQDNNLRLVSADVRKLASGSDPSLIHPTGQSAPPKDIYGKTNTDTWCYYFQKADLARQFGQWAEVVRLWNEAQDAGHRPDNGFEYIPFIEGFGHSDDWEQVKTLTKFSKRITAGLEPSLCRALDRLAENAPASQKRDETITNLKDDLICRNYQ